MKWSWTESKPVRGTKACYLVFFSGQADTALVLSEKAVAKPDMPFSLLQSSDSWVMLKCLTDAKVWYLNITALFSPGAVLRFCSTAGIGLSEVSLVSVNVKAWVVGWLVVHTTFTALLRSSSCPVREFTPVWTSICLRVCCSSVVGVAENFHLICCFHDSVGFNHKPILISRLQTGEFQNLNPLVITQVLYLVILVAFFAPFQLCCVHKG